tara:strand:+ start:206 stop:853 length:648 start_codon:yes stop_codon:yes gene_type:complete
MKIAASFLPLLLLIISPAIAAERVGSVERIQGQATVLLAGNKNKQQVLKQGSPVHLNDVLKTGKGARLKIRFIDDSRVVMGEKGKLRLDELVFNSAKQTGSQKFKIWGAFRYASGLIAKTDPQAVTLTMPVATIGIRGTDFISGLYASGMPPGQRHYGVMLISGAVSISNKQGGVVLDEPGEGTFLPEKGGKAPTKPRIWANDAMTEAFGSVSFR